MTAIFSRPQCVNEIKFFGIWSSNLRNCLQQGPCSDHLSHSTWNKYVCKKLASNDHMVIWCQLFTNIKSALNTRYTEASRRLVRNTKIMDSKTFFPKVQNGSIWQILVTGWNINMWSWEKIHLTAQTFYEFFFFSKMFWWCCIYTWRPNHFFHLVTNLGRDVYIYIYIYWYVGLIYTYLADCPSILMSPNFTGFK